MYITDSSGQRRCNKSVWSTVDNDWFLTGLGPAVCVSYYFVGHSLMEVPCQMQWVLLSNICKCQLGFLGPKGMLHTSILLHPPVKGRFELLCFNAEQSNILYLPNEYNLVGKTHWVGKRW